MENAVVLLDLGHKLRREYNRMCEDR
jgi:hypothetical protein